MHGQSTTEVCFNGRRFADKLRLQIAAPSSDLGGMTRLPGAMAEACPC
jgi:hypothetical protein